MTRKKVQAEEIKAADIPAEVQVAEQDIEKVEETNVMPEGAPVAEGEIPAETEQKTEEIEMDEKVKSYQAILKGTTTEKKEALKLRAEGYEEREFECPVLVNYKLGKKIVKHPETGEIISTSFLTAEERQRPLFPEEEQPQTPAEENGSEDLAQAEEMQDGAETLLDEAHAADEPAEPAENEPEEE